MNVVRSFVDNTRRLMLEVTDRYSVQLSRFFGRIKVFGMQLRRRAICAGRLRTYHIQVIHSCGHVWPHGDTFFHIPALEDGQETSANVRNLLIRSGYTRQGPASQTFVNWFLPRYLPGFLHKEVWPRITGVFPTAGTTCFPHETLCLESPPSLLTVVPTSNSRHISTRISQTCMHFARKIFSQHGLCPLYPTSANNTIPRLRSSLILEIWYSVQAQLLADGVPQERLELFGPLQFAKICSSKSSTFWHPSHLQNISLAVRPESRWLQSRRGRPTKSDQHLTDVFHAKSQRWRRGLPRQRMGPRGSKCIRIVVPMAIRHCLI